MAGCSSTVLPRSDRLVVFGDGIESDAVPPSWGRRLTVSLSARRLHLVV